MYFYNHKTMGVRRRWLSIAVVGALVAVIHTARSDTTTAILNLPLPSVYGTLSPDQSEIIATNDQILAGLSAGQLGGLATVWSTLEHGEIAYCPECVSRAEQLLYSPTPMIREIGAWWLCKGSRSIFNPADSANYVYGRVSSNLTSSSNAATRQYAANFLGECRATAGVPLLVASLKGDSDPGVRAAAASGLGRLGTDGNGALSAAMEDSDSGVKIAALRAAMYVNAFTDAASVAGTLGDSNPDVRRIAVQSLETMYATSAGAAIMSMARNDLDATVRAAACHALGAFGSPSYESTLNAIIATDPSTFVVDQAKFALLRL